MKSPRHLPTLPPMRCDDGCGRCCGPVPVTAREWGTIRAYMREHGIKAQFTANPLSCPLYDGQRCTIHPARPFLCRAFGHTHRLECPHGYNVNVPDGVIRAGVRANGKALGLLPDLLAHVEGPW